ncbi:hydratase, partial [Eubacteriales bacterium OttesenSCG-928-A19]|nr:hydratase [Eubacteriales bacterium OttesenSCG-928-A19]
MVTLHPEGVFLENGRETGANAPPDEARLNTIAYQILSAHNTAPDMRQLKLRFDSLTSHDITYVGIIQTARASGMKEFPMPYVLTNCHNSLCAVGGTINEDDHRFALSAAHKYGGIYVPTNLAVIHSYNREMMAACGSMILGSDSHTRYGALGTLAVGEGGGELAKQLLSHTYDLPAPEVVAVRLTSAPRTGVGPQDVALAIIGAVYAGGFVKNKVLEFIGDGIANLPVEYRNGIDVMTTETACWSSIWQTDERVREYYAIHGRLEAYSPLAPRGVAYYDALIDVDLSRVEPMIALPFHPSNTHTIADFLTNAPDILRQVESDCEAQFPGMGITPDLVGKARDGAVYVDQGIIAGCSGGTYDNLCAAADILDGQTAGNGAYTLSVYPGSQPAYLALVRQGVAERLMRSGAILRECFCGPCFGAGDTPANGALSIRHTTRNFLNREGSKPGE